MAESGTGQRGNRGERSGDRGDAGARDILDIEGRHDNLPPIQDRLWERNQEQNRAPDPAPVPIHSSSKNGTFIPLAEQSWGAQADLIKNKKNKLAFDTSRTFDGVVAAKSGIRGLYDPASPDYAKYEGLRTNLAVLRNTLLSQGMDEARLKTVAKAFGEAFANDTWIKRPFTNWLSTDVANVEAVGAGEMYKYLLSVQHTPAPLQWLRVMVDAWLGVRNQAWGLPPLEITPFSPANLGAPFPAPSGPPSNFVDRYLSSPPTPGLAYGK